MPGTVLGSGDTEMNKMTKFQLHILGGKTDRLQIKIYPCNPFVGKVPRTLLPLIDKNGLGNSEK